MITAMPLESKSQDSDFKPPGTEENAAVDQANTRLDAVYKRLMGKLDADGQKALKEAERSWIKWRDDEANSERIDSFAPARFGLRLAHLCRSRPRGSIREQAGPITM